MSLSESLLRSSSLSVFLCLSMSLSVSLRLSFFLILQCIFLLLLILHDSHDREWRLRHEKLPADTAWDSSRWTSRSLRTASFQTSATLGTAERNDTSRWRYAFHRAYGTMRESNQRGLVSLERKLGNRSMSWSSKKKDFSLLFQWLYGWLYYNILCFILPQAGDTRSATRTQAGLCRSGLKSPNWTWRSNAANETASFFEITWMPLTMLWRHYKKTRTKS